MSENEYEELFFCPSTTMLTNQQEAQILSKITLHQNENLLDLPTPTISAIAEYNHFMSDRVVFVEDPVTVQDGFIMSYKVYGIKTKKNNVEEWQTYVERRYSDFLWLAEKLTEYWGGCVLPCLPTKNIWASFDLETQTQRWQRKQALEKYINKILTHPKLKTAEEIKQFLFDPDGNFSSKRGQYTLSIKMEDKLKIFTYEAYQYGSSIMGKYLGEEEKKVITATKEDHELMHYNIVIKGLKSVVMELKTIIQCTHEEARTLEMLQQFDEGKNITLQPLWTQYEELVEFVMCCSEALSRRQSLRQQLQKLKTEEDILLRKNSGNPRNIQLDIQRSTINKKKDKFERWTKDLLEELEGQIYHGKSLVKKFVQHLSDFKWKLYS